jgi:hypothetical protein
MTSYDAIYTRAISEISAYPIGSIRTGMTAQNYMKYKADWNYFNTVWAYNYTTSTINLLNNTKTPAYEFQTTEKKLSYLRGKTYHLEYYSTIANVSNIFCRKFF